MADEREEQLERFGEAVEQKNEEARRASEQTRENPPAGDGGIDGDERSLTEHGRPQDVHDVRQKSAGKGKKTADKWNQ